MNYRGIELTAQIQLVLTALVVLAGIVLAVGGFTNPHPVSNPSFAGSRMTAISAVAIQVPMLFSGFAIIPQAAEEVDMPARSIALTIFAVVGSVAVFYIVSIWAAGQALPAKTLGNSLVPAAAAMGALFNSKLAGQLMTLVGIAALLTSWSAFVIGASRLIFAMADAGLLPRSLTKVHPKYNTPSNAILLIGVISVIAPWLGAQSISPIINAGSLGYLFAWFAIIASFLVLRYRRPDMERPFKVPAGIAVGSLLLIGMIAYMGLYMPGGPAALGMEEWISIVAWILLGTVLGIVSGRGDTSLEKTST